MTIPANIRIPFQYVEFDGANAQQGSNVFKYSILLVGNMLATGTKNALEMVPITNKDQGAKYFGSGSIIDEMIRKFMGNNSTMSVYAIGLDDDDAGVAATSTLTLGGAATRAGVLYLYVGGELVRVPVAKGDTAAEIAASVVAEVGSTDNKHLVCTAANVDEVVTFTMKNKGLLGNSVDIRVNYHPGEETPDGVTTAIVAMANGAANPDLSEIFPVIGDKWFQKIVHPYTDAANLTALDEEFEDRFGYIRQIEGVGFSAERNTFANQVTLGESRNSKFTIIMDHAGPANPWAAAAGMAAEITSSVESEPARPLQTLEISGVLAPTELEVRPWTERNNLLHSGIGTTMRSASGKYQIERVITTYRLNQAGAADTAYLNYNTIACLSYIRYDYRNTLLTKYPRHMLASDGTKVRSGKPVVTPKTLKAEVSAMARRWEKDAVIENADGFIEALVIERNENDRDRTDSFLSPDLMNQFRVGGTTIGFLL